MKTIFKSEVHKDSKSHQTLICEINNKKVKIKYVAENAFERCDVSIFDGNQFNPIIGMYDMGEEPNNSAYIWDTVKRKKRAEDLITKGVSICKLILK